MDLDSHYAAVSLDETRTLTSGTVTPLDTHHDATLVYVVLRTERHPEAVALVDIAGPHGKIQRCLLRKGSSVTTGGTRWKVSTIMKNTVDSPDCVTLRRLTTTRHQSPHRA